MNRKLYAPKAAVGELRPSQMLYTYGIGAIVDLPKIAAMVMGLDDWDATQCDEVCEERLLAAVRAALGEAGEEVIALRTPPFAPEPGGSSFDVGPPIGVPVAPFPRWLMCPSCRLLSPIGSGLYELKRDPYRPEKTRYVHRSCPKSQDAEATPVRFLLACKAGHLDDFPWQYFVHGGPSDCRAALRMTDFGVAGQTANIRVNCEGCGAGRDMSKAFGDDAASYLPGRCSGRRPHLRDHDEKPCPHSMKCILFGASNAWFPSTLSTLYLPTAEDTLGRLVEQYWDTLGPTESRAEITICRKHSLLTPFAAYTDDEVWAAVEAKRAASAAPTTTNPLDIKQPEWEVFSLADTSLNGRDFELTPVNPPEGYHNQIEHVVLVEKLREVRAIIGFSRIEPPGEFSDGLTLPEANRAPLSRKPPTWVPACEVRGEGIFIQFKRTALETWLTEPGVLAQDDLFARAYGQWREAKELPPALNRPDVGYVLLHSFAHALIRQLTLECGYAAASIQERIYWSRSDGQADGMAGLLIYTAAPDSEGTLGGLVSLGEPKRLGRHIDQALEMVRLCASDPLCSEHHPFANGVTLHGAACHACLFLPETSCERSNTYLDRAVLVPTLQTEELAFFTEGR
jgi:hypothetical protein